MADEFDASSRPSKRRRTATYNADRTILKSPEQSSALSNVSNAISNISMRFFGRGKSELQPEFHDDSTYGSKEDSLNEEDIVLRDDAVGMEDENAEKENTEVTGLAKTGRKRKSATGDMRPELSEKSAEKNEHSLRRRRTTRLSQANVEAVEREDSSTPPEIALQGLTQQGEDIDQTMSSKDPFIAEKSSRRRKSRGKSRNLSATEQSFDEGDNNKKSDQDVPNASDVTERIQNEVGTDTQVRSSGRERKKPRRFSNDMVPVGKPKTSQKRLKAIEKITLSTMASPEKASSPQPRGILTPSKRKRDGPRKSVVFDESEKQIEEHFGFKDIEDYHKKSHTPAPSTKTKSLSPTLIVPQIQPVPQLQFVVPVIQQLHQNHPEPESDDLTVDREYPEDLLQSIDFSSVTSSAKFAGIDVEDDPQLRAIKTTILSRITAIDKSPIAHLPVQYDTLHNLLSATITTGESNSLLLLGSRGAGKSLLVDKALSDLTSKHGDDFHVIRLNGFFQTDDKLALREIWRQLGREMQVSEDETGEVSSYADTMASLLSILSHPEEMTDIQTIGTDGSATTTKSVIFILAEFDLFTTHPRQTLLYNLFDIAQSRKAPIAVIGCSTRMDVVECLEKRVKSRFSHRWLHVPTMKSLPNFIEAIQGVLCLNANGPEALGLSKIELEWREQWNEHIKSNLLPAPEVQSLIKRTFHSTKSLPDALMALYIPIATVNLAQYRDAPSPARPISLPTTTVPPTLLTFLPDLPLLHLSLLIAASRLDTIHNLAALNFNLVYSHYTELVSRTKLQRAASGMLPVAAGAGLRVWTKETARMAWEELGSWEVIVPVSGLAGGNDGRGAGKSGEVSGGGGGGGEGGSSRMWRVDVTLEEVAWAVKEKLGVVGVGEILGRWCREIVF